MTTTSEPEQGQRKPGRPRSAQAHKAILDAALELLAQEGFQGLSIEDIAARAGVGKTTIYRRWSSKDDLVIDAIHEIQVDLTTVDTGNFRNDLVILFKAANQGIMTHPLLPQLVLRLISEFQANPEIFQVFLTQLLIPRIQRFIYMVEQAQARGEIRRDIDWTLALELITGPIFIHLLISHYLAPSMSSSDDKWIEQMIDAVMDGIGTK
ncbi:MAG TPA: TetR/AcrR family transcriptional regulator [Ktedonobacteraceae bacterium]